MLVCRTLKEALGEALTKDVKRADVNLSKLSIRRTKILYVYFFYQIFYDKKKRKEHETRKYVEC